MHRTWQISLVEQSRGLMGTSWTALFSPRSSLKYNLHLIWLSWSKKDHGRRELFPIAFRPSSTATEVFQLVHSQKSNCCRRASSEAIEKTLREVICVKGRNVRCQRVQMAGRQRGAKGGKNRHKGRPKQPLEHKVHVPMSTFKKCRTLNTKYSRPSRSKNFIKK